MKTILFRPFHAGKWFALGFSAWLATLGEGGANSSFQGDFPVPDTNDGEEGEQTGIESPMEEFEQFRDTAMQWIQDNQWVIGVAIAGLILILAIFIVICWLNSRGKFMFLDNVVHNRAEVALPWREYRAEGNSLFRWVLCFHLATGAIVIALLAGTGYWLFTQFTGAETFTTPIILVSVGATLAFLAFIFLIIYAWTLLTHFVVPQMYQHRINASEAWGKVLRLQRERGGALFVFFLLQMLLGLASGMILLAFALMTCCIGLIVLAIPYLGAVLMLPITVFFRALGPEFLRQFGPEYDLLASRPPTIESV
ncbi:hypothetical protein VSU19_19000 [Verrucomicrobiales bacterium BCK34]|nr:hypothetical protein [Verrucomicrobiales bacterium BCK34]